MSNMSYCRFRNTCGDVTACLNSIRQNLMLESSEAGYGRRMFKEFLTLCRDYDIIDGYDGEAVDELFDGLQEE